MRAVAGKSLFQMSIRLPRCTIRLFRLWADGAIRE